MRTFPSFDDTNQNLSIFMHPVGFDVTALTYALYFFLFLFIIPVLDFPSIGIKIQNEI